MTKFLQIIPMESGDPISMNYLESGSLQSQAVMIEFQEQIKKSKAAVDNNQTSVQIESQEQIKKGVP